MTDGRIVSQGEPRVHP